MGGLKVLQGDELPEDIDTGFICILEEAFFQNLYEQALAIDKLHPGDVRVWTMFGKSPDDEIIMEAPAEEALATEVVPGVLNPPSEAAKTSVVPRTARMSVDSIFDTDAAEYSAFVAGEEDPEALVVEPSSPQETEEQAVKRREAAGKGRAVPE